jgi:hypothetical protein
MSKKVNLSLYLYEQKELSELQLFGTIGAKN